MSEQILDSDFITLKYHPQIINAEHRVMCLGCELAYFLIKDIVKTSEEQKT